MYKGIGESAFNDGLFSQAAPFQNYQGSVSQFAEGSLGRLPGRGGLQQRRVRRVRGVAGPGAPFRDGMLGRTFLPAFSPQAMRGLGYTYNDGVLGDAVSDAAYSAIAPNVDNAIAARQGKGESMDVSLKVPFNQIVAASLLGIAAYLVYKR